MNGHTKRPYNSAGTQEEWGIQYIKTMYSCLQLQVVPVDDGCIKQSPQGTVTRFANLACKLARQYEELSRTTKEQLAKGAIILIMSREGACLGSRGPR